MPQRFSITLLESPTREWAHRDRYQDLHEKKLGKANQEASERSFIVLLNPIMFFNQIKITNNSICLIADAAYVMDEEIARTQSRVTSAIINSSSRNSHKRRCSLEHPRVVQSPVVLTASRLSCHGLAPEWPLL
jgi:hypothetical protein